MEDMDDNYCSIQLGEKTIPLEIQFVDYKEDQLVYKVTNNSCDFLPQKLVIKPRPRNPDAHYTFDMEGKVYLHLSDFQGRLIPQYWGVAQFHHSKTTVDAHVIEQINGTPLTDYAGDISHFKAKIIEAYKQLSEKAVIHGDVEPRHIFIVGPQQTLTLIDFGLAKICENRGEAEMQNSIDVEALFETYELILKLSCCSAQALPFLFLPNALHQISYASP